MIAATLIVFLAAIGAGMARRWGWSVLLAVVTLGMLVGVSNGA